MSDTIVEAEAGPSDIVRAVWRVMAEQGIGAVSMRTVAAAASVSVGRIQYRYRTKSELLRASLEAMLSGAAEIHADAADGADDQDELWHLMSHSIPRSDAYGAGVALFHQYVAAGINHPELARMLADAKAGQEREAGRLLARIATDLTDPEAEGRALVAIGDGLAMRVLMGGVTVADAERTLRAAIERYVGTSR